ncbi:hypothetical protein G7K_4850-t1 [Saitoella complicata NRRL Y-17804]|uniref:Sm domain-containing protein n=2 Tax=Saitoella complicata (strain BCRC 22490 / CBS 7301 / JCM 7358 / NBRC 10748 / NRRL Y-17804) TaxID=698492 RepID=A0A0E9NLK6_SAICN|nr:hypothetical protein G7K_4850-t1 [Saitoella complicata NRRL Y-17804]
MSSLVVVVVVVVAINHPTNIYGQAAIARKVRRCTRHLSTYCSYGYLYAIIYPTTMLFYSFFKTLIDQQVTVELKNDLSIQGTLKSVDQFLNISLHDINVLEELKYPHLSAVKNVFIRGSVVRYVHLPSAAVDTALLEDATRREAQSQKEKNLVR